MQVESISSDGALVKLTRHEIRILRYAVGIISARTEPLDAHPLIGVEYDTLKSFSRDVRRLADQAALLDD
jgi:hypothetical protein